MTGRWSGPAGRSVEMAIVGGGPAGAALATRLAAAGREVVIFERWREPRWRASGVYSSPRTRTALLDLGLSLGQVGSLLRPISELLVESVGGVSCRLIHGTAGPAVGVDRVRLERALLDRARAAGALVREGAVVREVSLPGRDRRGEVRLLVSADGALETWRADIVVGADGPRSLVAREAGVALGRVPLRRAGLTMHRADPSALEPGQMMTARLVFGPGWYCGVTPVPRGRVNVGIVLSRALLGERLGSGLRPATLMEEILRDVPVRDGPLEAWREAPPTDTAQVSLPLAHRVRRLAGPGFLLVGDAAGFVDPVTGEGIGRALHSAEHAADAIERLRRGDRGALGRYDTETRRRYARKDLISWLLQAFMSRPTLLEYAVRRLDHRSSLRATFGMVMSDLAPPERVLDPRFVVALLAP